MLVVKIEVFGHVLDHSLENLVLHGKISFPVIWQTQPSAWASISVAGLSQTEQVSCIHAAHVQSDGLEYSLQKVLHGFISFTFLGRRESAGWRVFY